ncbi:transglutaminase family protein [Bremerella cremea]|uniref:Transglutaminase family protein n=1 Tax=Bremerella cremea TaxID=1031537 RepID=A0A368KY15_9BACT|nr:transglutaminase family protein [Bremerella cremea]RCS54567.1 transglutaminase family protein [Bremerella cremea]
MVKQLCLAVVGTFLVCTSALAQFGAVESQADAETFETGFKLEVFGPTVGVAATFPVPAEWEDQKVKFVEQEVSPSSATVRFVDIDGTRQARVDIPRLAAGDTAQVLLRYEVQRDPIVAPTMPNDLTIPDSRSLDRLQRKFLLPSPLIESRDQQIVETAKSLAMDGGTSWDQVKAYYDFVHQNVTYENGPMKGAVAALNDGRGDCEEMTTLFVALCRAGNVPARTVWVPGHCYPEFLVKTADGADRWVAVEMTNDFPFGQSPEKRPILQKGDNFRLPGNRKSQHYVKQELVIRDYKGTTAPVITWLPPPGKEPPPAQ